MSRVPQIKEDIVQVLRDKQGQIKALGVRRLALFGSFVRGQEEATSDVDFLVEFEPGKKTFDNFIRLSFFLEDMLQRRVEVVTPEALSPYIGPKILQEVEYVTFAA